MNTEHSLEDLREIRGLMDRSTRFLSLSGLSGIWAGIVALAGATVAQRHLAAWMNEPGSLLSYGRSGEVTDISYWDHALLLITDAVAVLLIAMLGAFWFTWRRSRRTGQGLWDAVAMRMAWNLFIPLAAGGIFCLILFYYGLVGLVAPVTLVFYGLALLNASKYTLDEIRWLGLTEIALGLAGMCWLGAGLLFWAIGFGVLHILYGALMYIRHERRAPSATE